MASAPDGIRFRMESFCKRFKSSWDDEYVSSRISIRASPVEWLPACPFMSQAGTIFGFVSLDKFYDSFKSKTNQLN